MSETELVRWAVITRHPDPDFRFRAVGEGLGNPPIVQAKAAAERMARELVGYSKNSDEQIRVVERHAYPNINTKESESCDA